MVQVISPDLLFHGKGYILEPELEYLGEGQEEELEMVEEIGIKVFQLFPQEDWSWDLLTWIRSSSTSKHGMKAAEKTYW